MSSMMLEENYLNSFILVSEIDRIRKPRHCTFADAAPYDAILGR
jgi:hypothetical protein